jgi:hypothetical protein
MQADAEKVAEAKERESQEREAAMTAEHNHVLEVKAAELATILEEKAQLQALVNESAAAHKAHAELKELKVRQKCAPLPQFSSAGLRLFHHVRICRPESALRARSPWPMLIRLVEISNLYQGSQPAVL